MLSLLESVTCFTRARCGLQQQAPSFMQQLIEQTADEPIARDAVAETGTTRRATMSDTPFSHLIQSRGFMHRR